MPLEPLREQRRQRDDGHRPPDPTVIFWAVAVLAALAVTASSAALALGAV